MDSDIDLLERSFNSSRARHTYRVTFTFDADRLTTEQVAWCLRAYSDLGAPDDLRMRMERTA